MDANIFDYITWRGDLTFEQAVFNEVDAVVLSMLSYLNLNGIVPAEFQREGPTLEQVADDFFQAPDVLERSDTGLLFNSDLIQLLKEVANSARYNQIRLCGFVDSTDLTHEKQFAAFTATLDNGTIFIAYRGTDDTLVGWKEDFNMAFTTPVPSQKDALAYLKQAAASLHGKIRLGGHSKGGNLAVFAATFCHKKIKRRILDVYNNDGPGFEFDMTTVQEFLEVAERIHTFVPQSSVVGMLLEHEEKHTVIRSNNNGLMQHNPFSWQLDGPHFVELNGVTDGSMILDKTIKDWLKKMNRIQREQFVDALYEMLTSNDAATLSDLSEKWMKKPASSLHSLLTLDEETRRIVWDALQQLLKSARNNIPLLSNLFGKQRSKPEPLQDL